MHVPHGSREQPHAAADVCADVKTGEGGYVKLAIIMSMMAQTIQCEGCARSGSAPT